MNPAITQLDQREPTRPPIIALTGFMAAGKSTIGRVLAFQVRWRFIDLDYEIESNIGLPIREIFAQQGEEKFRRVERDHLLAVLEGCSSPTVIALGGGTFVQPANAAMLREHGARVIFLHLAVEELLRRCREAADRGPQNARPLAADEAAFRALYEQRLSLYRQAEFTIDTHGKSAEIVAGEISQLFQLATNCRR